MRRSFAVYSCLLASLILFCSSVAFSDNQVSSESDLKKRADRYFTAENYDLALQDYSRLLSLYPQESNYNYRFGVCLLIAGKEKSNAATYLEIAAKDPKTPKDVWFYLGKSIMINNNFSKAKEAFDKFKSVSNISELKKYDLDASLQNCESGMQLIKERKNVVILNSREVSLNAFYNNYDFSQAPGRIVNASGEFLTGLDKSKIKDPVMYVGNDRQKAFVASYGKNGETGKDLYIIRRTPDNQWSLPEKLGPSINTSVDEDYAFLARDGKTLYFSSKGHNSIGGYDIFKSVFDFNTNSWKEAENMGIPINTVGDDFLFVPDEKGPGATYTTTVESGKNLASIRKIQMPSGFNEMLTISGTYVPIDQKVRRDARISILTSSGDGIITTVHTDPTTGKYELVLEPGQNYMIVVEGGGYLPHSEIFDLPAGMTNPDLKQVVKINKDSQKEELTLQNYFASGAAASVPTKTSTQSFPTNADAAGLIGVKINDQVVYVTPPAGMKGEGTATNVSVRDSANADSKSALPSITIKRRDKYDPTLAAGPSSSELHQEQEEAERTKEIEEENANPDKTYDLNISNEELAQLAYDDAMSIREEADSLKNEVSDLRRVATEKQNLSVALKNQSETPGLSSDSAASLLSQSEINAAEAKEMYKQADDLSQAASAKESEAAIAMKDADDLFKASKGTGTMASNSKRNVSKSKTANQPVANQTSAEKNNNSKPTVTPEETKLSSSGQSKSKTDNQPKINQTSPENTAIKSTVVPAANNVSSKEQQDIKKADEKKDVVAPEQANAKVPVEEKPASTVSSEPPPSSYMTEEIISEEFTPHAEADNSCPDETPLKSYDNIETTSSNKIVSTDIKSTGSLASVATKTNPDPAVNKTETNLAGNSKETVENKISQSNDTKISGNNNLADKSKDTPENIKEAKPVETSETTSAAGKKHFSIEGSESLAGKSQKQTSETIKDQPAGVINSNPAANNVSDSLNTAVDTRSSKKNSDSVTSKTDSSNTNDEVALATVSPTANSKSNENIPSSGKKNSDVNAKENSSNDIPLVIEKKKPIVVETVKADKSTIVKEDGSKKLPQPVKEEASVAYRAYQKKMEHSNQLTNESIKLQDEISRTPSSSKRDSLIRESNDLTLESMKEWKEGLTLVEEARKSEPNIDYKMNVNDFAENNRKAIESKASHPNPETSKAQPAGLEASAVPVKPSSTKNKTEYFPKTVTSTKGSKTVNHNSPETESEANLDTTNVEYPKYVQIKKEINETQVKTIDVFAEAVNLNKKALEERDLENSFMDKAHAEKDSVKRSELIKKSFEYKTLSDKHAEESRQKFASAQSNTSVVKGLRNDLTEVRNRITRKPSDNTETASINPLPKKSNNPEIKKTVTPAPDAKQKENNKQDKKEPVVKKKPAEVFAKADKVVTELNSSEEDISSVSITDKAIKDFERTTFGNKSSSIYSDKNPIPMNPDLPEGLVFKVQIGAFHKPLRSDIFKGLQPLSGETTRPGWIRYCVGLFKTFEPANIAKKEVQRSGYKDAFVVAYYNGKRIELNEAYRKIKEKENLTAYKSESAKEVAMLRANNIRPESSDVLANDNDERSFYGLPALPPGSTTAESVEYAVQVGVYRTSVAPSVLASLQPLVSEEIRSNLYRYTSGRYPDRASADVAKANAVAAGVPDAFVVVYRSGKKAEVSTAIAEAKTEKTPVENTPSVTAENKTAPVAIEKKETVVNTTSGIIYKVQIGAYKNDVPYNVIESYLEISDKGITRQVDDRNLHIFYAGSEYKSLKEAAALCAEVAAKGVKDAFVVALSDGKRIPITDEMKK